MRKLNFVIIILIMCSIAASCSISKKEETDFDVDAALDYCHVQIKKTLSEIGDTSLLPNNILDSMSHWNLSPIEGWTSGFWPGILWYDYKITQDESIKTSATHYTELLEPLSNRKARDHDLGFQIHNSFGNAYKQTQNEHYKQVILNTADTLTGLYNEKVGTLCSWPGFGRRMGWPHNSIIDNMMNLELLFWAAKHGGSQRLYDVAVSHAEITMNNHFRPDGSCFHVAVYDTISGKFMHGATHQGFSDKSTWARGQAWAIYGYTIVYRETGDKKYLDFVEKLADLYLSRLPEDYVPYWDFDAPNIPNEPKDASAASITASALLEISTLHEDINKQMKYKNAAIRMLKSLSSKNYQSRDKNPSFLLHSTGHAPNNSEVDASLAYADYYYIEALVKLKEINQLKEIK